MTRQDYQTGGAYAAARHGEQCASKLTEVQAMDIYRRRELARTYMAEARTLSNPALAEKIGISAKAVGRIINGHRWRNSRGKSKYKDMTPELADLIRRAAVERDRLKSLAAQHSAKVLAAEYGVSVSHVDQIGMGRRWVHVPGKVSR